MEFPAHLSKDSDCVRKMTESELAVMLDRMGLSSDATLCDLQWGFLTNVSIHNVDLLSNTSRLTVEECINRVVSGCGGCSLVCATAFLAMLRGLGIKAWLGSAKGSSCQHAVVLAREGDGLVVCDVGHGHPYICPFPLDGRMNFDHLGWSFRTEGDGTLMSLNWRVPGGQLTSEYSVRAVPNSFEDFEEITGWSPNDSLSHVWVHQVRAVLIREDVVISLQNGQLVRYSAAGATCRRISGPEALQRVLHRVFDITESSSDVRQEFRPADRITASPGSEMHPEIVVSLATTDRTANLRALMKSISAEWSKSKGGREGQLLRMVVLENSEIEAHRRQNRGESKAFTDQLDVIWVDDGEYGRSIAKARQRQTKALAEIYQLGEGFDIAWMIDDDVEFAQLWLDEEEILRRTTRIRYFDRIRQLYRAHPEASVLVGKVCGDPPIRPEAVLATQLLDTVVSLEHFCALEPDAIYQQHVPSQSEKFKIPDYYYDHTRAGCEHLSRAFLWLGRVAGASVREEAVRFLGEAGSFGWGRTPLRPLLVSFDGQKGPERTFLRRGGNTLFFDVDALFRHSYPSLALEDAVTRRSDMVGATLLSEDSGTWVADSPLPLVHRRRRPMDTNRLAVPQRRSQVLRSMCGEFFGVLVARCVMDSDCNSVERLEELATGRRERIIQSLKLAAGRARRLLATISMAEETWMGRDERTLNGLRSLEEEVEEVRSVYLGGARQSDQIAWLERVETLLSSHRSREVLQFVHGEMSGLLERRREDLARWFNC